MPSGLCEVKGEVIVTDFETSGEVWNVRGGRSRISKRNPDYDQRSARGW